MNGSAEMHILKTMEVLYYLRKRGSHKQGKIYCRIIVDDQREEFSTGIKAASNRWKNQQIVGEDDIASIYNRKLLAIKNKIYAIELDLFNKGIPVTAFGLKERALGKTKKIPSFIEAGRMFITEVENGIPHEYSEQTLKLHKSKLWNIMKIIEFYKKKNISITDIDIPFVKKIQSHLAKRGFTHNHVIKHIEFVRSIIKYAITSNMIDHHPVSLMKLKKAPPKPIVYLDEKELERLENKTFDIARLKKVKDVFIFQCYTGMSYAELEKFSQNPDSFIQRGIDNKKWLFIQRGKTKKYQYEYCIPILKRAHAIIDKYDGKIPVLTNQKYNAYLKEIADLCEINKHLTTHIARKTLGMLLLNNDVPIETVSKVLGHKSIRTTQEYYAKIQNSGEKDWP